MDERTLLVHFKDDPTNENSLIVYIFNDQPYTIWNICRAMEKQLRHEQKPMVSESEHLNNMMNLMRRPS